MHGKNSGHTHMVTVMQRQGISLFGKEKPRGASWRSKGQLSLEGVVHYVGMVFRAKRNPKLV